ncbi:ATP-binding protein [Azospira sp. I09]|jgi:two-component system sensor histidine kinase KdpD|uniref:ATP-binding protein n=1 Tax=Azospira sp. I09 TaxID=1765049 RepID=UPI001260A26A|nr:ATP-binding protein [Azospira sp. I09]BBN87177.1 hypothetical protein AZSP09_02000 [Azospira sp. I09]
MGHLLQRFSGYLMGMLFVLLGTALAAPFRAEIDLSNLALLYVLAVVAVGGHFGRGPAVACAMAGSLAFAYVFVPPHFSLAITEIQYVMAAVIMVVVALVVGHLTAALRTQVELARDRARRARALYELAKHLAGSQTAEEVTQTCRRFLADALGARRIRLLEPATWDQPPPFITKALVRACLERRQLVAIPSPAPGISRALLPLAGTRDLQGLLGFEVDSGTLDDGEYREALDTMASVVAVALERTQYAAAVRESELRVAAETLRGTILASLSHDLRTPLTALVGMADGLALGKVAGADKQKSMLLRLRDQALAINQLLGNLLEMARLRSGNVELQKEWQPIEEVIGATMGLLEPHAGGREIVINIAPDLPPVHIDGVLIERVLWNLLENALKYSPAEQSIELRVAQSEGWLELSVCDRGEGLAPGQEEDLFGLFRRGRSESNVPGAGLGLAIARTIAEAHGGSVSAANRSGGGACFCLRLPLETPPDLADLADLESETL